MGPIYTLDDVIDMVRRRAMMIFIVTVFGGLAMIFFALSNAHEYEAIEVIQVESPLIADDISPTVVEGTSGRRLQSVQHQLTSRGTLLDIIEQYGIYDDLPALSLVEKSQALRESISLDGIEAAGANELEENAELSAMRITVRLSTPELAQQVAREISQRTIELYAARRIEEANTTLQFFSEQEDQLYEEIQEIEDEIATYRTSQDLSLSGSIEFRRAQISALNTAILDIERERITVQRELDLIGSNTRRQSTLEREVRELETELLNLDEQRALLQTRLQELAASIETSPEVERQLGVFDRELTRIRQELDVVSTRRAEAEVAVRMETERKSERLVVLEQASLPENPATPSRTRMVILGTAASSILGVLIGFVMELRNPVIRTPQQMEREIGIAPVITLPNVSVSRRPAGRMAKLRAWFRGQVPVTTHSDRARKAG